MLIEAAKGRDEPLDHILLSGPPGLGKTTLAGVIANELGVHLRTTSGPAIERAGDLAAILTNLEERDVLFIDEIHRLNRQIEEVLYPAMEDFSLDIVIGKGPAARSLRLDLPRFTLVGATTRTGLLTGPLRDRFGMAFRLDYYSPEELAAIVTRSAVILEVTIDADGADEIARRSRGTPRLANRLLKRVRDYAQVRHAGEITEDIAAEALAFFEVDHVGLDRMDLRDPRRARQPLLGQARRAEHARDLRERGAGHARGRVRAVPAAARLPDAHAEGPPGDAARLRAPRAAAAGRGRAAGRALLDRRPHCRRTRPGSRARYHGRISREGVAHVLDPAPRRQSRGDPRRDRRPGTAGCRHAAPRARGGRRVAARAHGGAARLAHRRHAPEPGGSRRPRARTGGAVGLGRTRGGGRACRGQDRLLCVSRARVRRRRWTWRAGARPSCAAWRPTSV